MATKQKTIKQPKTGLGSTAETNRLLGGDYFDTDTGKQTQTFTPKATTSPVSILSTDKAVNTLNKGLTNLNQISPTTAPDYVPPATPTTLTEPKTIPKAYFTNDSGQEAEFNETQLKDSSNRKFLTDNGYVQTRTEGPSFDTGSSIRNDVDTWNQKYESLADDFLSYNVDKDPAYQGLAGSIAQKYTELRKDVETANRQREGSLQTLGFRTGATQYAGAIQQGIQGEELNQANSRIADVISREAMAISEAREAFRTGKFADFQSKLNLVNKFREEKTQELKDYNTKLADITKSVRESTWQSSRDSAVAGLLSQGITDPKQILNYLNEDDQGKVIGDFTAEEVAKTLKNLAPEGNTEKLSGNIRDYFLLKENGSLPGNISALPEDQQLAAWMNFMKPPKTTGAGKSKVGNKITATEARSNNLPLSVVGMSEEDILGSMYESSPPNWFVDKLSSEKKMSVGPDQAAAAWEQYRQAFIQDFESDEKVSEAVNYTDRAKTYFQSAYGDSVTEEDAQALADQVQLYVEGGLAYKAAVEKVIEESQ